MNKLIILQITLLICVGQARSHASVFNGHDIKQTEVCSELLQDQKEQAFQEILEPFKAIKAKEYRQLSSRKLYQFNDILDTDLRALIPSRADLGQGLSVADIEANLTLLIEILKKPRLKITRNKSKDLPRAFLGQRLLGSSFAIWSPFISTEILGELLDLILRREMKVFKSNNDEDGELVFYGKIFFDHLSLLLDYLPKEHYLFTSDDVRTFLFQSRSSLRLVRLQEDMPASWQDEFYRHWSTAGEVPSLMLDNLIPIYETDKGVKFVACGSCSDMAPRHIQAIRRFVGGNYKKTRIVLIDGELVGSFKYVGDKSFLALANVYNFEGQQLLAAGMVYQLEQKTLERVNKLVINGVANYPVDESFIVHPRISIMTDGASRGEGFRQLVKSLYDEVSQALASRSRQ